MTTGFVFIHLPGQDAAGQGRWRQSPLYDVVPSPAVGFERFPAIGVGRQGRLATLDNALSHAGQSGLRPREAEVASRPMIRSIPGPPSAS